MSKKFMYEVQKLNDVSIFNLYGELSEEHESELNLLLMRAIHGVDRAVVNLKHVTAVDAPCLIMLRDAYTASRRVRNPLMFIGMRKEYEGDIVNLESPSVQKTDRTLEISEIPV
jgi:anti-anti-sigma regulatory factor